MKKFLPLFLVVIVISFFNIYNQANANTISKERKKERKLNICNDAAEIANKRKPYRVDKYTRAIKTYCSVKNGRTRATSLFQLDLDKKDLPSDILQVLEQQNKPLICNEDLVSETLELHDIAMEYIDVSGVNVGTILITKEKCK